MSPFRVVANVATVLLLVAAALAPLFAAYRSLGFVTAAAGGVAIGAVIAVAGWRWRWNALTVAAIAAVAYFVFGGALALPAESIAGVIPTLQVLSTLAIGVVQVWKQALTLPDPFVGFDELNIAPYLLGLVVTTISLSLALRLRRRYGWALLPPVLLLGLAVAFSTYLGFAPAIIGAIFAAVALAWAAWRSRRARADDSVEDQGARSGLIRVGAIATGMVAVAAVVGGTTAVAATASRSVLRDHVVPPLELHDYASPLTSFRKMITDGEETELFTVTGLPSGARIRLAALDAYDGTVYQVSGGGGAGSGVFSRVGREIDTAVEGASARVTVEVGDLAGVWLPTVGYLRSLAFLGADASTRDDALHYNAASGTAVVTTAISSGDTYEFTAVVPPSPDEEELGGAELASISTPSPALMPDALLAAVDTVVADAASPIEQVRAVEAYFQTEGFFSHGLEGEVASRAGHTVSRENDLIAGGQMIGDDEQYAVAMALMLSQLGIPVRVVMGFAPEGTTDDIVVTGDDLHAWVEVPFEKHGWVAFSPTPSEDKVPQEQTPEEAQKPRVQVAQPPDVPQEPAELPPAPPVEEAQDDERGIDWSWLWATLQVAGISLAVLVLLLGPSIALAIARAARRRRRARAASTAGRVQGGWDELVDAASDVGTRFEPVATRREQGRSLEQLHPEAGFALLADRADVAIFGAGDPTPAEVDAYWADVATASRHLRVDAPWHRRLIARMFPASVIRGLRPRRRGGAV